MSKIFGVCFCAGISASRVIVDKQIQKNELRLFHFGPYLNISNFPNCDDRCVAIPSFSREYSFRRLIRANYTVRDSTTLSYPDRQDRR